MVERAHPYLILALGNDLLGDDAVGLLAARALRPDVQDVADVVETGEAGLALLELMEGYERALLLDAVWTRRAPPGTVLEFSPADFSEVVAPSPHYAGLPEVLALARRLDLPFPGEIRILGLEVENLWTFTEELTPAVDAGFAGYVDRARSIIDTWRPSPCTNIP